MPRNSATEHSSLGERLIAGVPAQIMRPRLIFIACMGALCLFGLLMVYSASAVEALTKQGDSMYFFVRQAAFMAVGFAVLALIVRMPKEWFDKKYLWGAWGFILALLVLVAVAGTGSRGATRWINIAGFSLQPSEFAKPVLILLVARLFYDFYETRALTTNSFVIRFVGAVGACLALIVMQPDLGTTLIITATLALMACYAGIQRRTIIIGLVAIAAVAAGFIFSQPYRITRIMVAMDPWSDQYGDGFQATYAIMAFASGGLFGRGIGNSTVKYNYLPEAHNDYILAIIGEELGYFGTLLFFAVFLLMVWSAFEIARHAPNKFWGLVAAGSATILMVQFFVNILGILNVIPMTGKPLPFVSYGGSSIVSSIILGALVIRASVESGRATVHDMRRGGFSVVGGGRAAESDAFAAPEYSATSVPANESTAGVAHTRSGRPASSSTALPTPTPRSDYHSAPLASRGFSVMDGDAGGSRSGSSTFGGDSSPLGRSSSNRSSSRYDESATRGRGERSSLGRGSASNRSGSGRGSSSGSGYDRVDLNSDPSSRLRTNRRDRYDR